jgi:hypothetical protein
MNMKTIALSGLLAASTLVQAQTSTASQNLNFSSVDAGASLSFSNVLNGVNLTITPLAPAAGSNTSLQIKVVDLNSTEGAPVADEAIGVQVFKTNGQGKVTAMDAATLDKNQSLLFTFSQAVRLTGFNMDYATNAGASLFSLSVNGATAQNFRLDGSDWLASGLTGTTFQFGVVNTGGASYAIDSVSLASLAVTTPNGGGLVTAVPEPETYALMAACLGVLAVVTRRRKSA